VSRNEQFNQGYEEMIDTIKSRAVWRVGETLEEGETFRGMCPKCRYESLHQRFDITRHRLLFGKAIRQIETPRPMVRCRRCSEQRHLRDVGELVVPSTIALFDEIRTAAVAHLATQPTAGAALPAELDEKLAAFREEASGPIRQQLLVAIAGSSPGTSEAVTDLGRALYLAADQIAAAVDPDPSPPASSGPAS
jgi:hypothetical protein